MSEKYFYAIGRRKTSTATIRLFEKAGENSVNSKSFKTIYRSLVEEAIVLEPLKAAGLDSKNFMFTAVAKGGGKSSQLQAVRHALARAIIKMNPELKPTLKKAGLLTRDPRMVERKKAGLRKARKSEQYSKR